MRYALRDMSLAQDVLDAATVYDRAATEEAAQNLVSEARKSGVLFEEALLRKALAALRNNRWFPLLQRTADGIMQAGDARPSVRKLYAQSLIETGAISAAIAFLERLAAESGDNAFECDEARALLGRAWKQAYVGGDALGAARAKSLLDTALRWYYAPYVENRTNYYQGINTVACLARAERDKIGVSGDFPDWRVLARELHETIEKLEAAEKAQSRDYATAGEACVALGDWQRAIAWYDFYLKDADTTAFSVASSLRQLTEVWQLSRTADDGSAAPLLLLEATMMKKEGGQRLDTADSGARLARLKGEKLTLEAVLGTERYKPIEWLETGLRRSRAVGRIFTENGMASGTGFLVSDSCLGEGQFFITNNHVIPTSMDAKSALVAFEALDEDDKRPYPVVEQLWTSESQKLDATVLRLKRKVKNVEAYPICDALPDISTHPSVFVIGHPLGGRLAVSITDNVLLDHLDPKVHYRAPTDPGSSGSPVFDTEWRLLALHHGGGKAVPKLHGDGVYQANEGMYFPTIAKTFMTETKRKKRADRRRPGG